MNTKPIYHKVCKVCGEHYTTTVRHQKYCGKVCQLTAQYNQQNWHLPPVKRAPQWWLDRRLGGNKGGAQDDVYLETFRITLKEEMDKLELIGCHIDKSKVEMEHIRLHSATRNWGLCYWPWKRDRTIGGTLLPANKYCFAFNRELMRHTQGVYRRTVMHELIHVYCHQHFGPVKGRGHGAAFKAIAQKVNNRYAYGITRCTPRSKFEALDRAASGI